MLGLRSAVGDQPVNAAPLLGALFHERSRAVHGSAVMQQVQLPLQRAFNQSRPASPMSSSHGTLSPQLDLSRHLVVSVTCASGSRDHSI